MQTAYLNTPRILTFLLAIAVAIASVAGAFFPGTYARDQVSMGYLKRGFVFMAFSLMARISF